MGSSIRAGQGGQAAVEWVGVVVAIALALGALALLASRQPPPSAPPVDPIASLARPLTGAGERAGRAASDLPSAAAGVAPGAGASAEVAAWLARTSRSSLTLGRDMGGAFGTGFAGRVRERVRALLSTPPSLPELPTPRTLMPGAMVRDLVRAVTLDPAAVVDYVRALRGLPAREAAVKVSGDAGVLSAEVALEAAEFLVKRLIARGLYRTAGAGPGRSEVP